MKMILFSILGLFLSFSALAETSDSWSKLVEQITLKGQATQAHAGVYLTVSKVEKIGTGLDFVAEYISTVGGFDERSQYHVGHVEVVSETWKVDSRGNWDIDQWLFSATKEGVVKLASHVHLVESPRGQVLVHERLPSTPEENQQRWKLELQKWEERLGLTKP